MSATVFQAPGNRALKFIDTVDASALPDPSTLNNGDFYIIQTGGTIWGETWANGDRAVSDGTNYSKDSDATKQVGEGGTGSTTAAGARTNLGVNSTDEDIEANLTKFVRPSLHFVTNDYIEFGDDGRWSFTNGIDDLPMAIVLEFEFPSKPATRGIFAKFGTAAPNMEWALYLDSSDRINFSIRDSAGDFNGVYTTEGLTAFSGKPVHVAVCYGGSGPNSTSSFANAHTEITIYINGVAKPTTQNFSGVYDGMSDSSQAVWMGRRATDYFEGNIFNIKIYNRELTADQVDKLARGGQIEFADKGADHTTEKLTDGGFETWTSGSNLTNWTEGSAITIAQETTDKQAGTYAVKLTGGGSIGSSGNNWLNQNALIDSGIRYRFTAKVKRVSGTTDDLQIGIRYYPFVTFDGTTFTAQTNATYLPESRIVNQASLGNGWYSVSVEFITHAGGTNDLCFGVTGGTDPYFIDDCSLVDVGLLAEILAENFDESTDKLYVEHSNVFVGVNNGASLVGRAHPVYKPGTFNPGLTFGGGNTGMVITASEGFLTRDGNLCHIEGMITLSAKGSSTGPAVITGLEFLGPNLSGNNIPVTFGRCANMANLTSPIIGNIVDNSNTIALQDVGAAGSVDLDETNFTDTTIITFSATYRIQ